MGIFYSPSACIFLYCPAKEENSCIEIQSLTLALSKNGVDFNS
jgi:hypothetical protein